MLVQVTGEQAEGIYGERLQAADWCEVLGLGFSSDVSVGFLERARQHLLHKHLAHTYTHIQLLSECGTPKIYVLIIRLYLSVCGNEDHSTFL